MGFLDEPQFRETLEAVVDVVAAVVVAVAVGKHPKVKDLVKVPFLRCRCHLHRGRW